MTILFEVARKIQAADPRLTWRQAIRRAQALYNAAYSSDSGRGTGR